MNYLFSENWYLKYFSIKSNNHKINIIIRNEKRERRKKLEKFWFLKITIIMGDCIFFHYNFRRRVSIWLENPDWRSLEKVEAHIITTPRSGCSVYYLRKKRLKLFGYSKVSVLVACESSLSKWWVGYPKIGFSGNPTQQQTGLNPHVLYSKVYCKEFSTNFLIILWNIS